MRVLYFSTVNWKWIKQRPHFLTEYLSNAFIEIDYFSLTPFGKQRIKRRDINQYLKVKDTYVIPFASKFKVIECINIYYVKAILKNSSYDKIIITDPQQYKYLTDSQKDNSEIIYECMDNIPYFYSGDRQVDLIRQEEELCHKVDKIIVSSNYLGERIKNQYKISTNKIHVILNAVDRKEFTSEVKKVQLKQPNLVYIGTISEWFDLETIKAFAQRNKDYSIYIIGPIYRNIRNELEQKYNNIIWINSIPHSQVKDYISASDIMLIPFKVNELVKGVDPVKMYEYLAMNSKIVSAYWEELDKYKNMSLVEFYSNHMEFEKKVYKLQKKERRLQINREYIETNCWEGRVQEYLEVLIK